MKICVVLLVPLPSTIHRTAIKYDARLPLPWPTEIIIKALFPGDGAAEWTGFRAARLEYVGNKMREDSSKREASNSGKGKGKKRSSAAAGMAVRGEASIASDSAKKRR